MTKSAILFLVAVICLAVPFGFAILSYTVDRTLEGSSAWFVWDWQWNVGYILTPAPTLITNAMVGMGLVLGIGTLYWYVHRQEQGTPRKLPLIQASRWTRRVGIILMAVMTVGFVGYCYLLRFLVPSVIIFAFYGVGIMGLVMMYRTYRQPSWFKLAVGVFVVAFAMVGLEILFWLTLGTGFNPI